jgi:hypothetical protein
MNWQRRLGKITTGLVALELVQGGGERLLNSWPLRMVLNVPRERP